MDPVTFMTLVSTACSAVVSLIGFVVYHKWIAFKPVTPATATDLLSNPLIKAAVQHGTDLVNQLVGGAVKGGVSQVLVPVLASLAKQLATGLETAATKDAPPPAPPKA